MKKVFYLVSLACMFMFAACSSDDELNDGNGELITIGVGMPGADGTRVYFSGALNNMVWNQNDQLTFWNYWGGYNLRTLCNIEKGWNTPSAQFTVKLETDDNYKYEAQYAGAKVNFVSWDPAQSTYGYDDQTQGQVNSMFNLKDHLFLTSGIKTKAEIKAGNINLIPRNCIFDLNVKDVPTELLNGKAEITFKLDGVQKAFITLTGGLKADGNNHIYFAFAPGQLNKKISFDVTANGVKKTAFAESTNGKTYKEGMIYTATIDKASVKKALHWETKPVGETLGYSNDFTKSADISGWYAEGTGATLEYNDFAKTMYIKGRNVYFVAPAMQLGSTTDISMTSGGSYMDTKKIKLAIREYTAAETKNPWTILDITDVGGGWNSEKTGTLTEDSKTKIASFANSKVEVAIFCTDGGNRELYVYNFNVNSTK